MFPPTFGASVQYLGLTTWLCGISAFRGWSLSGVTSQTPIPAAEHSDPFHAMPKAV
jgi:hypothetical protein